MVIQKVSIKFLKSSEAQGFRGQLCMRLHINTKLVLAFFHLGVETEMIRQRAGLSNALKSLVMLLL